MILAEQACHTPQGGLRLLEASELPGLLEQVPGWACDASQQVLHRTWRFADYYHTTAFVNAVVWQAHQADHHPEICFGYRECQLTLTTHAVQGLSLNDFILAARINRLTQD